VAAEYMIRLKKEDLDDPDVLSALADAAGTSEDDFKTRYAYITDGRPQ
jgi:hypothetical protein